MAIRNNGGKTGRRRDGTFAPGNPGRPKGARHRITLAVEALLDGEAEELTRTAVEKAKSGDMVALKLCLDRIAPPRRDAPVTFDLPAIKTAADACTALSALLTAVAAGEVTPGEASGIAALVERFRRAVETEDLERRVSALEGR